MNTEYTAPAQGKSFLPLLLLSLSLIVFFTYQLMQISKDREDLKKGQKQLTDFIAANGENLDHEVTKAQQVVGALKKLGNDVYELSKFDDNAKTVITNLDKVGIKFQGPPPGEATAPAPAPSGQQP